MELVYLLIGAVLGIGMGLGVWGVSMLMRRKPKIFVSNLMEIDISSGDIADVDIAVCTGDNARGFKLIKGNAELTTR